PHARSDFPGTPVFEERDSHFWVGGWALSACGEKLDLSSDMTTARTPSAAMGAERKPDSRDTRRRKRSQSEYARFSLKACSGQQNKDVQFSLLAASTASRSLARFLARPLRSGIRKPNTATEVRRRATYNTGQDIRPFLVCLINRGARGSQPCLTRVRETPDDAMVAGMVMPLADLRAIYELLFRDGVMVAKKDKRPQSVHPEVRGRVTNLQVVRAMGSLKSRGFVKETFTWRHYYWYLTNEGVVYLRDYLHLPPEIVPSSLQRVRRQAATLDVTRKAARVQTAYRHRKTNAAEEETSRRAVPRFRGRPMTAEPVKPKSSWEPYERDDSGREARVTDEVSGKKVSIAQTSRPLPDTKISKAAVVAVTMEKVVAMDHEGTRISPSSNTAEKAELPARATAVTVPVVASVAVAVVKSPAVTKVLREEPVEAVAKSVTMETRKQSSEPVASKPAPAVQLREAPPLMAVVKETDQKVSDVTTMAPSPKSLDESTATKVESVPKSKKVKEEKEKVSVSKATEEKHAAAVRDAVQRPSEKTTAQEAPLAAVEKSTTKAALEVPAAVQDEKVAHDVLVSHDLRKEGLNGSAGVCIIAGETPAEPASTVNTETAPSRKSKKKKKKPEKSSEVKALQETVSSLPNRNRWFLQRQEKPSWRKELCGTRLRQRHRPRRLPPEGPRCPSELQKLPSWGKGNSGRLCASLQKHRSGTGRARGETRTPDGPRKADKEKAEPAGLSAEKARQEVPQPSSAAESRRAAAAAAEAEVSGAGGSAHAVVRGAAPVSHSELPLREASASRGSQCPAEGAAQSQPGAESNPAPLDESAMRKKIVVVEEVIEVKKVISPPPGQKSPGAPDPGWTPEAEQASGGVEGPPAGSEWEYEDVWTDDVEEKTWPNFIEDVVPPNESRVWRPSPGGSRARGWCSFRCHLLVAAAIDRLWRGFRFDGRIREEIWKFPQALGGRSELGCAEALALTGRVQVRIPLQLRADTERGKTFMLWRKIKQSHGLSFLGSSTVSHGTSWLIKAPFSLGELTCETTGTSFTTVIHWVQLEDQLEANWAKIVPAGGGRVPLYRGLRSFRRINRVCFPGDAIMQDNYPTLQLIPLCVLEPDPISPLSRVQALFWRQDEDD
ncbi:hypothetical protein Z043_104823, partial [Scleropages formosus]